ncbi:hypothetical protein Sste5346_004855 [Sporothrix stenoceras]|uniref:Zn(2)-C6 fungal-type domain-containing protein n=1 Tax=Sporothrix stenoceras TaxID=5173 RepID=A0ABR3Z7N7_9PEZI
MTVTSSSSISKGGNNPRKRGRTACTRCKTRKQKCDEQWPVCSNCQVAGATCDKKAVANHGPSAQYTRALEERILALEADLAAKRRRQSIPAPDASRTATPSSTGSPAHNAINEIVTMIPLGNLEAPAFVGPSSGLSMALNLGEMVQATIWNKAFATAAAAATAHEEDIDSLPSSSSTPTSSSRPPISLEALMTNSAKAPPADTLGRRMIDTYLHQLHPRYPFIDRADVWRLHGQRHALAAAAHSELSREQRFGVFKLYMVYAIGATLIALTDKRHDRTTLASEGYYLTALQHVAAAREPRTIQNIEAMILLALYHLRESSCHGMWYMVGLAMRTCIDLGMHRAAYETGVAPPLVHRRRLLFWSVYSLDRTIAMSLGRPLSITDRQIDVGLPEDPKPEDIPDKAEDAELSTSGITDTPLQGSLFIQLCRLKRIESQVHLSIYRVDKPVAVLARKIDRFYAALEEWKAALPPCFHDFSEDKAEHSHYLLLHYNRVLRLLLQPFLAVLPPSSPYYARCLRAAGAVCRAHKQLHQTPTYAHSFISVQTVFMAGVTLLYALWTRPQAAWSAALADDLRSCSLVLFVMGERAAWVRKFRDTFERLVSAAMEKLQANDGEAEGAGDANDVSGAGGDETVVTTGHSSHPTASYQMDVNADWPGPPMNTPQDYDTTAMALSAMNTTATTTASGGPPENESWRMAEELATWVAHDNGVPDWMPDLEMLPNLWSG